MPRFPHGIDLQIRQVRLLSHLSCQFDLYIDIIRINRQTNKITMSIYNLFYRLCQE